MSSYHEKTTISFNVIKFLNLHNSLIVSLDFIIYNLKLQFINLNFISYISENLSNYNFGVFLYQKSEFLKRLHDKIRSFKRLVNNFFYSVLNLKKVLQIFFTLIRPFFLHLYQGHQIFFQSCKSLRSHFNQLQWLH